MAGDRDASEVLFEYRQMGAQIRVAAIDPRTGTEAIIIVPLSATERQMQSLALAKLKRLLAARA